MLKSISTGAVAVERPVAESVSKLINGSPMIKGTGLVRVSMTATLAQLVICQHRLTNNNLELLLTPCAESSSRP